MIDNFSNHNNNEIVITRGIYIMTHITIFIDEVLSRYLQYCCIYQRKGKLFKIQTFTVLFTRSFIL